MKIIQPSVTLEWATPNALQIIEKAGRTCYKSEEKITNDSAEAFVRKIVKSGHDSVLEHATASFRFITDRAIANEVVRHRVASFCQESTRYVSSVTKSRFVVNNEDDVVQKYNSGYSMRAVSELSNGVYSEWQVYKILDQNQVERRHFGNTGLVSHDFFDSIDTVEKAYLFGFIQADGSIRSSLSPQLTLTQHKQYSWYIYRMVRNFLRPGAKRSSDKNCHSISVISEHLHKTLIEKGIVPNKSYAQTSLDIDKLWGSIPHDLIPSFLRGFLDGDGNIRFYKQNNQWETDSCTITWSGNIYLLRKIQEWLISELDYKTTILEHISASDLFAKISVTNPKVGEQVVKLMLNGFKYPYGHPQKTSRMIERVGGEYQFENWGDPKFQVILPKELINNTNAALWYWMEGVDAAEDFYAELAERGCSPQISRSVLPLSLKTELVCTTNFREWRHILKLRTSAAAHPQIREVMDMVLQWFKANYPVIVEDINPSA